MYGGYCGRVYRVYRGPVDMFRPHCIRLHDLLDLTHEDLTVLLFSVSHGHICGKLNIDTDELSFSRDHHKSSVL